MLALRYIRRAAILLPVMALIATLVAINGSIGLNPTDTARLTPEGAPYRVSVGVSGIKVANVASDRNNREVYWNGSTPESAAATVCSTWASGTDIAQNGIAFRIQQRTDGGYNAIVLERNIWANLYWVFNVVVFYTGAEYDEEARVDDGLLQPFSGPMGVDLSPYLGMSREAVYPLRICATLTDDDVLSFAVAKGTDPLPPPTNPGDQGGRWQLDLSQYYHAGQGKIGRHGIYAAHIPVGTALVFDDVTVHESTG